MATCDRCGRDSLAWRAKDKPVGSVELRWICNGCYGATVPVEVKRRTMAFYRKLTYQIVMPVLGTIFAMIELGLHL